MSSSSHTWSDRGVASIRRESPPRVVKVVSFFPFSLFLIHYCHAQASFLAPQIILFHSTLFFSHCLSFTFVAFLALLSSDSTILITNRSSSIHPIYNLPYISLRLNTFISPNTFLTSLILDFASVLISNWDLFHTFLHLPPLLHHPYKYWTTMVISHIPDIFLIKQKITHSR